MNKIVYDLLLKLEQCDDKHNRCDYLMEHDEITYLLEHIEEKDKEIERLKAREQECIDKYLAESKYRGEVEGKYVLAKYVIDELEKDIKEDNQKAREYMKKVEQSGMCQGDYPVHYYYADKRIGLTEKYLERLKELKEGE